MSRVRSKIGVKQDANRDTEWILSLPVKDIAPEVPPDPSIGQGLVVIDTEGEFVTADIDRGPLFWTDLVRGGWFVHDDAATSYAVTGSDSGG